MIQCLYRNQMSIYRQLHGQQTCSFYTQTSFFSLNSNGMISHSSSTQLLSCLDNNYLCLLNNLQFTDNYFLVQDMSKFIKISLLTVLIICVSGQTLKYDRVFLTNQDEAEAQCLDGSPGAHYLYKGDPNKVLVFFYGGGWCGQTTVAATLESCYQRSKGALGSSNFTTSTIEVSAGLGSANDANPFKNWTKVFLTYCDGSGHQGYKKDPVDYKGVKLYFKGQRVVKGHFNSLERSIGLLTKVDNIVLSGASAGGLATYLWTNWLRDNAKAKNIWSLPDSGIFLNQKDASGAFSYEQKFISLMKYSNAESVLPPCKECVAKHKNQIHKCMFAENIYQDIKVPLFNVQSQYDSWSIPNVIGVSCLNGAALDKCSTTQLQLIEDYHQKTKSLIDKMNLQLKEAGAWSPVCADHVYVQGGAFYSQSFRIPQGTVYSPAEVIRRWIQRQPDDMKYVHVDQGKWPDNKPCSGVKATRQYQIGQKIAKLNKFTSHFMQGLLKKIANSGNKY